MNDHPSNCTNGSDETGRATDTGDQSVDFNLGVRDLSDLVSDHAVALFDDEGRVAIWNEGARHLTGYDTDEIVGTHYRTLFPADDRDADRPERILERARSVGKAETEGWRLQSDGERFWAREVLAPIHEDDEVVGYAWFVNDRTEAYERERELRTEKALTESILAAQPDILYAYDAEGNLIEWNAQFQQVTGYDPDELAGMHPLTFIAPEDRDHIRDAIERILEEGERVTAEGRILTNDGARIPYEFNSARITDGDGEVLGFTGVGRNITDRKARERELERLERLNAIVRTIDETMVAAETRDEIETAVVEEFAAADAYRFAAIGRADAPATSPGYSWEPETWAGIDAADEHTEELLSTFIDPPPVADGASPFDTRAVQRYRHLDEQSVEAWRTHAREHDYGAVAVVPIVASDRPLGALVIAADEPSAFADREREVLREFGGTIGHAINAMTVRRLLYRDTAVELEFESSDRGDACIRLSDDLSCELSIDHVLPLTDRAFVYYLTTANADTERVREIARDDDAITDLRCIDAGDDECYWELVVRGSTIPDLLAEYGARLQSKTVRDGVADLTVQVSPDANLRELVDVITSAYPDTRLVSKQTVERPVETRGDFRRTVESMLTEKQRLALEAAYHGGYFEWPTRNSDAAEIAERLGIARQTFHQHLRVAQAKLLSAYFGSAD
ncbi:bacterio-opsin activator domain-containing protein [Natrinema salifodinae]|uniref:PAS domain S-box-containing protein n=1 Tax=Natrinema salifodinae TaxID=1202768 RepID=A0A1I0Q5S8_9EURY|nr:bacterio-opsin activator domain-containing protein [Natrinema salifodinae]SEW22299.1 PAS domain S-box-containing protein [Natrinema salifodinae]